MVEDRARGNEAKMKAGMARSHAPSNKHRPGRFYPLRGRVRCGLCGRSMEGCHQKGSNWYRCQYVTRRGPIAADIADHPRVLGVKEANVLNPVLDFLARRIFGPDRLRLLRAELADSTTATWREQDAELERLTGELRDIDRSLHRQTLRLEEHEDSDPSSRRARHSTHRGTEHPQARRHRSDRRPQGRAPRRAPPRRNPHHARRRSRPTPLAPQRNRARTRQPARSVRRDDQLRQAKSPPHAHSDHWPRPAASTRKRRRPPGGAVADV
jgi:site-specific DNA recombinase